MSDGARTVSYRQLDDNANRIANGMRAAGVVPGDRVAYLGRSSAVCAEILVGSLRAGTVATYLNWRLHQRELPYVLADCRPRVVIVTEEYASLLETLPEREDVDLVLTVDECSLWTDWLAAQDPGRPTLRPTDDDVVVQLYTSGTTGRPKGAMLTRAGLTATMTDLVELWNLDEESVALAVLPMFHITGIGSILTTLLAGAHLVVGGDPSPAGIAASITEHGVTHVVLVTSLLAGLVDLSTQEGGPDLSSLRTVSYGAAPITEELLTSAISRLGCDLVQVYGLTETTGALTALTPSDHHLEDGDPRRLGRLRSCGRPRPGVEVRIVDTATGADLPTGAIGEILARASRVMSGYWNHPEATAEAMLAGGWLRTSDLGELDSDGYLYLHDRLQDMIISGGENIYPAEVEDALQWHPDVAEVAVIGVPDQRWGETPHAVIVPRASSTPTGDEIIAFARGRLAHYKCPTSVTFVANLPRNATGKVLRRELREPHWASRTRRVN